MIDCAVVVSDGGCVLWNQRFDQGYEDNDGGSTRTMLNKLIQTVILEERGVDQYAVVDGINFRWKVMHKIGATMYIMYQGIQNLQVLNELLEGASRRFVALALEHNCIQLQSDWIMNPVNFEFDEYFRTLLYDISLKSAKSQPPTEQGSINRHASKSDSAKKPEKTKRQWHIKDTVSKQEMDELDFSNDKNREISAPNNYIENPVEATADPTSKPTRAMSMFVSAKEYVTNLFTRSKSDIGPSNSDQGNEQNMSGVLDSFSKIVQQYAGNMLLTEEAIEKPLKELKMRLNSKNVASDISAMICDSVSARLVGKKTASLTSVTGTVRKAVEDSVRRILTPKEPINLIQNVTEANAKGDLYSVLFLGVNGVGKSTSLAKVTYLLKCNGFKPLLIACDTFRSGAVEQLKIHADKLGVELFERGYGKDPSAICKEGMKYAKTNGFNVVLIDTAGRMQDNEPLMAALAKLIQVNNPNLLLFVGEALVGNDAVDQLRKFNQAIHRISEINPELQHRKIDGIILTKFDTVDDKVGAALSMCYITGQPIVFVGTGQTYTNISKLEINDVVAALTK